jgi:hypothetical protein
MGIRGTLSGSAVAFVMEDFGLYMQGTAAGGEINGDIIASPMGVGEFRMVPSGAPFGHLELEGNVGGFPVSLNTEFGLAGGGVPETRYNYSFALNTDWFAGTVWLQTRNELYARLYTVTDDEPWEEEEILVTLWPYGGGEIRASGGTVDVTFYDGSAIAGLLDLQFSEAPPLFADLPSPVPSGKEVRTFTHSQLSFSDHERQVIVWISVGGVLGETTYYIPDVWFSLRWTLNGEGLEDALIEAESGWLTISRYDESGVEGSFNIGEPPGDTLAGSFDLSWWEGWEPGE